MSYKRYIDENEKFLNSKPSNIQARNIDILIFSILSFAFGFAGGLMPDVDGLMIGVVFFLLIGLFVYHPVKKK